MKAQGIGDSVSPALGPGKYSDAAFITTLRGKFNNEKLKEQHLKQWHKML